jgi:uncharacterized membrane protein
VPGKGIGLAKCLAAECRYRSDGCAQPLNAAGLFLLIRKMTADKVLEDLRGVGGTVMRTSFDHTKEAALRDALASHAAAEAATSGA